MTTRILIAATMAVVVFGLTLVAGPFFGSLTSEALFTVDKATEHVSQYSLDSMFTLNYAFGSFVSTSESEFYLLGYIWQGFGLTGGLGAFDVQADLLFGPSTAEFIYAQEIVTASIAGVELGFYWATLSDAVLGGPANGAVLRLAGSVGGCDIVSVTELGARIRDDEFDGITIVHVDTGLSKSYVTNPIVATQTGPVCVGGFTGEKVTINGMSFGCIEDLTTTLYLTCLSGFEWVRFEVEGICTGLSWLSLDLALSFELQTKSIVLTPSLILGECLCIDTYMEVLTDAPDNTIYGAFTSLTGFSLYGLGFTYSWQGVTVKELTVFDTGRYVITTPAYGSVIESLAEAVDRGHEYYPDYWELLSIEVVQDGCCGGITDLLVNTYFERDSGSIFGWGMTHVEGTIAINPTLSLGGEIEVDPTGLTLFGLRIEVSW